MTSFSTSKLFERYPALKTCQRELESALQMLIDCFRSDGKLLTMGNGGSSADAEHFCGELVKGFILKRPLNQADQELFHKIDPSVGSKLQYGFPAISLGVAHSLVSAFANDLTWEYVFAQQVHVLAKANDLVFAISTSGNSKNVVAALKVAKAKGVKSIALTGQNPSQCCELSDLTIRVPGTLTHEVQELHLPVYHALAIELEHHFYRE